MLLSDLHIGETGIIVKIKGHGMFRKRITEMGFIRGQKVTVIQEAPLKDPVEYRIMDYMVSLRRTEASLIEIIHEEVLESVPVPFYGTFQKDKMPASVAKASNVINVAMIGNPNSGKTSIFNFASHSYEKVGNYSGVTVSTKLARVEYQGYIFNFYDLPGTYSLTAYSPEELYVRNFLFDNQPDVIVNVIDATNLERNLFLTSQLIDMNLKVVIALNMFDELRRKGDRLDYKTFGRMIGIPMIPTIGSRGRGLASLFNAIIDRFNENDASERKINISYGRDVEDTARILEELILKPGFSEITNRFHPRFLSLKLIEKDGDIIKRFEKFPEYKEVLICLEKEISKLESNTGIETETIITDAKYGFIKGALKETLIRSDKNVHERSQKADYILTHRKYGIPIFFLLLWLMFMITFKGGKFPADWILSLFQWLSELCVHYLPAGALNNLIREGILGGVGGVLVFLPNILILFFFISLMEDTGYMARAAFIMDKIMHRIGLHGKSFIPLIMGFGCNVPAILSTRIIESRHNRLVTMLILPFMSCSARLPVYILIIGTFFPLWQGTSLFLIYLTGILLAAISALIFKKFLITGEDVPFVMELPPYRIPTMRNILRHMWNQSAEYLKRIGGVILMASVIVWGLNYYPVNSRLLSDLHDNDLQENIEKEEVNTVTSDSYLKRFGKFIEPVMEPLGFNWKMSVSLLAGIAGKEIVVSTMAVLYQSEEDEGEFVPLSEKLKSEHYLSGEKKGKPVYNPLVAISFLLFILIYFPCIAVVAVVARESGSLKWAGFLVLYTTLLAWIMSFLVYQVGSVFIY